MPGRLEIIFGPMFGGKTTELDRRLKRHFVAKQTTLLIKPSKDTRSPRSSTVTVHGGGFLEALETPALCDILTYALVVNASVIGIDEGQFFDDLVKGTLALMNLGKTVIIASLDSTFALEPFGHAHELLGFAAKYEKYNAVCEHCGSEEGSTSWRKEATEDTVVIGGSDKYESRCLSCYLLDPPRPFLERDLGL